LASLTGGHPGHLKKPRSRASGSQEVVDDDGGGGEADDAGEVGDGPLGTRGLGVGVAGIAGGRMAVLV